VLGLAAPAGAAGATLVVANKAEATASLIDLGSGEVVATLPTKDGPHEVGISPDGRFALVTNYGRGESAGHTLTLIDIPGARVVKTIDLGRHQRPHGVEWIDGSRAAVTVEDSQALAVVDVESGAVAATIGTDQQISHMVALDAGRQRAYVTSIGSGSLTVIDLRTGKRLRNIPTGEGAEGVAVWPGGQQIWVTNRAADTVTVLDAETLEILSQLPATGFPIRATATPGGQVLVTRARAGDLMIFDAASPENPRIVAFDIATMDVEERLFGDRFGDSSVPIGVVVDAAGKHAYVAHANADVITEIDLASGAVGRTLRAGREPDGMGFSPVTVNP
jgi:YVTN family beta-propeller protein